MLTEHAAAACPVAVVGGGALGIEIAELAVAVGHPVVIFDTGPGLADRAVDAVRHRLLDIEVGRTRSGNDALLAATSLNDLAPARFVIVTADEDLDQQRRILTELEQVVAAECVLAIASPTISPDAVGLGLAHPERVVGLHVITPARSTRLVEIVPGLRTDTATVQAVTSLGRSWNRTVVRATTTPGSIVDRVSRPFFAEAWRLYEERAADVATIDTVMRRSAGFGVGPFELMDEIGHDVCDAVARSMWNAHGHDPRFAPSIGQRALVDAGWLGTAAGRGSYDYSGPERLPVAVPATKVSVPLEVVDHGSSDMHGLLARGRVAVLKGDTDHDFVELPTGAALVRSTGSTATALSARMGRPVIVLDRTLDDALASGVAVAASANCTQAALGEAVGLLQSAGVDVFVIDDVPGLIVTRTVAMMANAAADALHHSAGSAADIDTAMRLAVQDPLGPLEWGRRWSAQLVVTILDAMLRTEGDTRYRACPLLRRRAVT